LTVITFINFVSHHADLITAISFISVWPSGPQTTNIYEVKVAGIKFLCGLSRQWPDLSLLEIPSILFVSKINNILKYIWTYLAVLVILNVLMKSGHESKNITYLPQFLILNLKWLISN